MIARGCTHAARSTIGDRRRGLFIAALLAEEFAYRFGGSPGTGHHEKMPLALQDVQFGTANGAAQDVRVVKPHQGVAFAGENQRALAQT
jgi:hypothetical protein